MGICVILMSLEWDKKSIFHSGLFICSQALTPHHLSQFALSDFLLSNPEERSQNSPARPLILQKLVCGGESYLRTQSNRHAGVLPLSQIYIQLSKLDVRSPALPFFHKGPITKLIPVIIERGFNEGEMSLTFECHSLLVPAVLCLCADKAQLLWQILLWEPLPKNLITVDHCSHIVIHTLATVICQFIGLRCIFDYHSGEQVRGLNVLHLLDDKWHSFIF